MPHDEKYRDLPPEPASSKYPNGLNLTENRKKQIYGISHSMVSSESINEDSVSSVSKLEIYRIDKKPTSLSDFANNLIHTKDLKMKEFKRKYYNNCFYEEKIQTNKKYYYFFRFLNEHDDFSYFSPVQVVELVDDGGYKYPIFDVIFEKDLKEDYENQANKPFKKLLQITPAQQHLILNTDSVDYTKPAAHNLDAMHSASMPIAGVANEQIWGKRFKFRITSKKTGKKIDLNIKYHLREF